MKAALLTFSVSRAYGGVFEICRRTAQTLAKEQAVDVSVFGLEDEFTRADLGEWRPLEPHCFRARGPRAYGFAPDLMRALDAEQPEVAHVQGIWTFATLAARRWAGRAARPYLVTSHGMLEPWALRQSRWKKLLAALLFEKTSLAGAACLHVNTDQERRHIRDYGLRNPVCVIPNGVDLPEDNEAPVLPPWSDRIPADAKVLLYLGPLHPKKGLPQLLQAWSMARRAVLAQARDWHLGIAGWDQEGHEACLQAQVSAAGLSKCVHFLGPQFGAARAAVYRNAQAFILPSFSQGLPMAVLEAWAHRLPVLMTRQCHLPEGFAAHAAMPLEPTADSIAIGLENLFRAAAKDREEMGRRGRELVTARFSWSRVAASLHEVYRWVLGGGAKPECVVTA